MRQTTLEIEKENVTQMVKLAFNLATEPIASTKEDMKISKKIPTKVLYKQVERKGRKGSRILN